MNVKRSGLVHEIKTIQIHSLDDWHSIRTVCGLHVKHNQIKRPRTTDEPINCIACLAN